MQFYDSEQLQLVAVGGDYTYRFCSTLRRYVGTRAFNAKLEKLLRQKREEALIPKLHSWLSKKLAAHGGEWTSHYAMVNVMANLKKLKKRVAPRILNAVLRCLTFGVCLETSFSHDGSCLLAPSCGGRHTLEHYLGSTCWHTERIVR